MINRYVEVTDEYVKQLEHEIDNLKAINKEHKKINGKLRKEYNKIQNLYEIVFAESQKQKEVIDKAVKLLGNYKHYSTPDEKQNSANEDLVNNAFDILKEVSE